MDADDGVIDGSGQTGSGGYSWYHSGHAIQIHFEQLVSAAGLVWTDGDRRLTNVRFEAFAQDGQSLGVVDGGDLSDESYQGTTADDHFFGVRYGDGLDQGISSLTITNEGGTGIEIDHIQYLLPSVRGDFNEDGLVNAVDIDLLTDAIRHGDASPRFDLTRDDSLNQSDLEFMITDVLSTYFGDLNLDGDVDFADFLVLSANFAKPGGWAQGNLDLEENVSMDDFLILSGNFGQSYSDAVAPSGDRRIGPDEWPLVLDFFRHPDSYVGLPSLLRVEQEPVLSTRDLNIQLDQHNGLTISARDDTVPRSVDHAVTEIGPIESALYDETLEDELTTEWLANSDEVPFAWDDFDAN